MKHRKGFAIAAIMIGILVSMAGCTQQVAESGGTSSAGSQISSSSAVVSSQAVSSLPSEPESSQEETSSLPEINASSGEVDESHPTVVRPPLDEAAFEEKFLQNPIDTAYQGEMDLAMSNVDMIDTANKYKDIWLSEIDAAYKYLLDLTSGDEKGAYKLDQQNWLDQSAADLQEIREAAGSGSMASVTVATNTMEYYRSRAKALYAEVYRYDPGYSYAFNS